MTTTARQIAKGFREEYRYERRGCGRARSMFRALDLCWRTYLSPKKDCHFCWTPYWTVTPWRTWVCGHPNCCEAEAHGRLGEMTVFGGYEEEELMPVWVCEHCDEEFDDREEYAEHEDECPER